MLLRVPPRQLMLQVQHTEIRLSLMERLPRPPTIQGRRVLTSAMPWETRFRQAVFKRCSAKKRFSPHTLQHIIKPNWTQQSHPGKCAQLLPLFSRQRQRKLPSKFNFKSERVTLCSGSRNSSLPSPLCFFRFLHLHSFFQQKKQTLRSIMRLDGRVAHTSRPIRNRGCPIHPAFVSRDEWAFAKRTSSCPLCLGSP